MDEFENRIINGIFTSQYVAAWVKERGECGYHYIKKDGKIERVWPFKKWLEQLLINGRHLTDSEVRFITNFATNGKLELQVNAQHFSFNDEMVEP